MDITGSESETVIVPVFDKPDIKVILLAPGRLYPTLVIEEK